MIFLITHILTHGGMREIVRCKDLSHFIPNVQGSPEKVSKRFFQNIKFWRFVTQKMAENSGIIFK